MSYRKKKVGILGGGQLGRMLLPPANYLDVFIACLDPNPNASCSQLANAFVVGDFTSYQDVVAFGQPQDIITIEIEHVNVEALYELEANGKTVYPQARVVDIIQDKRKQKQFYQEHNIPTSDFVLTEKRSDIKQHQDFLPAFHKVGKGGYDGGGVQFIQDIDALDKAFDKPAVLEKAVDFDSEISIITARNASGEIQLFPTVEMVFHPEHNLVDYLIAPAYTISEKINKKAQDIAIRVTEAFGIVGLLAVELFVTKQGDVLVNECAPRPHNSGHQTIQGATHSQFEQHLRAILNLPLAKPQLIKASAMVNLLGEAGANGPTVIYGMDDIMAMNETYVVLYGKEECRPYRKMGHVTILANSHQELIKKINFVKEHLKVGV